MEALGNLASKAADRRERDVRRSVAVRLDVANRSRWVRGHGAIVAIVDQPCSSWLDDNTAGWGWFVDPTPWDDSEFTTPGDQGEQGKMDLLTALAHEIGHLFGHDHEEDGVMIDTFATGIRRPPGSTAVNDWSALLDVLIAEPLSKRRW